MPTDYFYKICNCRTRSYYTACNYIYIYIYIPWMKDRPAEGALTCTTHDTHNKQLSMPRRDSNPQSQQASCRRPRSSVFAGLHGSCQVGRTDICRPKCKQGCTRVRENSFDPPVLHTATAKLRLRTGEQTAAPFCFDLHIFV